MFSYSASSYSTIGSTLYIIIHVLAATTLQFSRFKYVGAKRKTALHKKECCLVVESCENLQEAKPFSILESQITHNREVYNKKASTAERDSKKSPNN